MGGSGPSERGRWRGRVRVLLCNRPRSPQHGVPHLTEVRHVRREKEAAAAKAAAIEAAEAADREQALAEAAER